MILKVKSFGYFGIEPFLVDVEVDISRGLPSFNIVGLGDTAISESRERSELESETAATNLSQKK